VNTIYFWQDINEGLSEIRRVLKPGGIFVNAVYSKEFLNRLRYTNYGFTKYTEEELKSAAEQNHFEITEIITIEERVAYCYVLKKTKEPSPLSLSTVNQI
jgi:ubiquinone/menaquinone biosynthesis C-methylase UbiE